MATLCFIRKVATETQVRSEFAGCCPLLAARYLTVEEIQPEPVFAESKPGTNGLHELLPIVGGTYEEARRKRSIH